MTTVELQIWVGIVGSLVTVVVSVLGILNFQSRRDRAATVGSAFKDVVEGLASEDTTRRMAAAILLRRFFDKRSEQGAARRAYSKEAVGVTAGLLRECESGALQKVLADGLRYAPSLRGADLQGCNLTGAYLGADDEHERVDLTKADLFTADLSGASLKFAKAAETVFFRATLIGTVFTKADLTKANFQESRLREAKFDDAVLDGADFKGAVDIPAVVLSRLDNEGRVPEPRQDR